MVTKKEKIHVKGLAKRLTNDGLLTEEQAHQAFKKSLERKVPFVSQLVESEIVDSHRIMEAASAEFGVPMFDLDGQRRGVTNPA